MTLSTGKVVHGSLLDLEASVLGTTSNPATPPATAFVEFLLSPSNRDLLKKLGYTLLPPTLLGNAAAAPPGHQESHHQQLTSTPASMAIRGAGVRVSTGAALFGALIVWIALLGPLITLLGPPHPGIGVERPQPARTPAALPLVTSVTASLVALAVIVFLGTPLSYLMARGRLPSPRVSEAASCSCSPAHPAARDRSAADLHGRAGRRPSRAALQPPQPHRLQHVAWPLSWPSSIESAPCLRARCHGRIRHRRSGAEAGRRTPRGRPLAELAAGDHTAGQPPGWPTRSR